ncbi:MAG TPA: hypothetical protein VNQ76_17490, partial [Planctomicrobium sp.]|nr:hypothetical protein [Planctomicrobium sp.]
MIHKKTILVETELVDDHWTTGTVAAIDQAGFLASCLQSEIHLLSGSGLPPETSEESPALLERLHKETASALEKVGVGMTSAFIHEASSDCPAGQPAPLSFVFLSLPDLIDDTQADHRSQVLAECRNDLWLAAPQAFDPEIPCVAVYDDLTSNGELTLRA